MVTQESSGPFWRRFDHSPVQDNIQELIDEGTENRTVAATNMNQTSSRAHTIVSIFLEQKKKGKNIIF